MTTDEAATIKPGDRVCLRDGALSRACSEMSRMGTFLKVRQDHLGNVLLYVSRDNMSRPGWWSVWAWEREP